MLRKRFLMFIFLLLYGCCFPSASHAASYAPGTYAGLAVTANSDFTGGTYTINGNLTVNAGVTLTMKAATAVNVTGDILINGTVTTSGIGTAEYLVKLSSANGNISVNGPINITGMNGANGTAGAATQNGTAGSAGGTVHFELLAVRGNVVINGQITNKGGSGGTGGNGGGSQGGLFSGKNGGTGGAGGAGGAGGRVKIAAHAGTVNVIKPVISSGGAGGTGGTGGPDQSIAGGPGAGGRGGTGGNGGPVVIVGQDVLFDPSITFQVPAGAAGAGGAGGSGGTSGGAGTAGAAGAAGNPGAVTLVGGDVYRGTTRIGNTGSINCVPSTAQKTLLVDDNPPGAIPDAKFPYYKNATNVYFTNTTNPVLKVKLPQNRGFVYEGVTYTGSIANSVAKIRIYSYELKEPLGIPYVDTYVPVDPGQTDSEGYVSVPFTIPRSTLMMHYAIAAVNSNSAVGPEYGSATGGLALCLDTTPPEVTSKGSSANVSNTMVAFTWKPGTDTSGIAGSDVYINGVLKASKLTEPAYTYSGGYNQKVDLVVRIRDNAGNVSPVPDTPLLSTYTYPEGTGIQSVNITGSDLTGYNAQVSFVSRGAHATGYEIKYQQVDAAGQPVGAEVVTNVQDITAPAGSVHTHTVPGLTKDRTYRFAIRTYGPSGRYSAPAIYGMLVTISAGIDYILSGNETWAQSRTLPGNLIIPQGITLRIQPGVVVRIPSGKSIQVNGTILCDGTANRITFTREAGGSWQGMILSPTGSGSVIKGVIIEYAERGLVLNRQNLTVSGSIFRNNLIGLHMEGAAATVSGCRFENNSHYGIKEEAGCTPVITGNGFAGNGYAPYYSNRYTVLSVERINALLGSGNLSQ